MKRKWLKAALLLMAIGLLSGAGVLWSAGGGEDWTELSSVEELRGRFNEDQGAVRIVLLLSPT